LNEVNLNPTKVGGKLVDLDFHGKCIRKKSFL